MMNPLPLPVSEEPTPTLCVPPRNSLKYANKTLWEQFGLEAAFFFLMDLNLSFPLRESNKVTKFCKFIQRRKYRRVSEAVSPRHYH